MDVPSPPVPPVPPVLPVSPVPPVLTKTVSHAANGQRLDRVLAAVVAEGWPSMGLRGWRRACESGHVRVNDSPAIPGLHLRTGQQIEVRLPESDPGLPPSGGSDLLSEPRLISQSALFAALYKPAGWHSVHLSGGGGTSVAAWLSTVSATLSPAAPDIAGAAFVPHLLNRLDQLTSGLLVVARTAAASALWTRIEAAGQIRKDYLTLVEGTVQAPFVARQALNTADRRRVRLRTGEAAPLRCTVVSPLQVLCAGDEPDLFPQLPPDVVMTLVSCRIQQGARHQIRAHLAAAGHPLIGDQLYGSRYAVLPLLHHVRLEMPSWQVACPPPWTCRTLTLGGELLSPAHE